MEQQSPSPQKPGEKLRFEPANTLIGRPKLACFVDINLAGLLSVRLAELLADSQSLDAGFKDTALAAEIRRARQAQRGGKVELGRAE